MARHKTIGADAAGAGGLLRSRRAREKRVEGLDAWIDNGQRTTQQQMQSQLQSQLQPQPAA